MDDVDTPRGGADKFLAAKKLELAALNLKHYLKIQDEQVTLKAIVEALRKTQDKAQTGDPEEFGISLAQQASILAATFDFYLNTAKDAYCADGKFLMALKAQRQMLSTINTWRLLEKHKTEAGAGKNKKTAKRTEQNGWPDAPLDR